MPGFDGGRGARLFGLLVLVGAIVIAASLVADGTLQQQLRPELLSARLEALGLWGIPVLSGLMVLAVVVAPIPTVPIKVSFGLLFGFWWGSVLALLSALLGAGLAFGLARMLGQPFVARSARLQVLLCADCSERLLFRVVFTLRLIPLVSFALVSYAAGVTAMRARAFLLATALGMLPMTALYVGVGANALDRPWLAAAGGVLAVAFMFALPWLHARGWWPAALPHTHSDPGAK